MKTRIPGVMMMLAALLLLEVCAWAADGDFAWAKGIGGPGYERIIGIALDDKGSIYLTGSFREIADFDPGPGVFELNAGDEDDSFVLKLDNAGNFVWAVATGDSGRHTVLDIAVDGAGNIYTTGEFTGSVDFDPGPGVFELTSQNSAAFVWKLDSSGNFLWAKAFVSSGFSAGTAIAIDEKGNAYTTGVFCMSINFNPGPEVFELTAAISPQVTFISKLDAGGKFVWAKALHTTYLNCKPNDIAVDKEGFVYTTGAFGETMDFDPSPKTYELRATGLMSTYVSTLDKDGNFVRAIVFGEGHGQTVAVDDADNLYVLGKFRGTVDFDPGPGTFKLTSSESYDRFDIFLSKLNREGNLIWAIQIGGDDKEEALDFVMDAAKNLYLTGTFNGSVDFDPGPETAVLTFQKGVSWSGAFLMKLDSFGHLNWTKKIEVTGGQRIAVDPMEHTYMAGHFFGLDIETKMGDFYLPSEGGQDVALIKFYGPQPIVESVLPAAEASSEEGAPLPFIVTFSTEVTGVDVSDFKLFTTGTLSESQIVDLSGTGKEYTVMVKVAEGDGTIRLDIIDDDSITDSSGTPLGGRGNRNGDCIVGGIHAVRPARTPSQLLLGL